MFSCKTKGCLLPPLSPHLPPWHNIQHLHPMQCHHLYPPLQKWQQFLLLVSKSPRVPQMPKVLVHFLCSNTSSNSRRRGHPLQQRYHWHYHMKCWKKSLLKSLVMLEATIYLHHDFCIQVSRHQTSNWLFSDSSYGGWDARINRHLRP